LFLKLSRTSSVLKSSAVQAHGATGRRLEAADLSAGAVGAPTRSSASVQRDSVEW
jgi:hypothetical protein